METKINQYISGIIPPELSFLTGTTIELDFSRLGNADVFAVAYNETGISIPNTNYRFRAVKGSTVIEKTDGTEKTSLPEDWKRHLVVHNGLVSTWIGREVPLCNFGRLDLFSDYVSAGDGLIPNVDKEVIRAKYLKLTWLDRYIETYDSTTQEFLLLETPHHIFFKTELPPELSFLTGQVVRFDFDKLGLTKAEILSLSRCLTDTGIVVPHTNWRLRYIYMHTVVEPIDGTEKGSLPENWKTIVTVYAKYNTPTWVGNKIEGIDLTNYRQVDEGWVPLN